MTDRRTRIVILGSTGSIGRQALDVVAAHDDRLEVVALAAHSSAEAIVEQAITTGVSRIALADEQAAMRARELAGERLSVDGGTAAVTALAGHPDADVVLNALVGAQGLRATMHALEAGKRLALANKESLVAGGSLVTSAADPGALIPVDSEHSAIFQCLLGEPHTAVRRIWLTASGGPFRGRSRASLDDVTPAEALSHPTWRMGPKISVDSATLANKGLEVIEAHHLFGIPYDDIRVVIHPRSIVHSMVEYTDASVKAHLGTTDMRIPIQYAFSHPERWDAPVEPLDFGTIGSLDFSEPDLDAFPALSLAYSAGRAGGTAPAVFNAANEVAVAAFLDEAARFGDIPRVIEEVLAAHEPTEPSDIDEVEDADRWARSAAERSLARLSGYRR